MYEAVMSQLSGPFCSLHGGSVLVWKQPTFAHLSRDGWSFDGQKGSSRLEAGRERQDSWHSLNNSAEKQWDAWMDNHVACKRVMRA